MSKAKPEVHWHRITTHSGSGKSTLLNLIGLLNAPSSGELFILGQPRAAWTMPRVPPGVTTALDLYSSSIRRTTAARCNRTLTLVDGCIVGDEQHSSEQPF